MPRPLIVLDVDDTLYLERSYVLSGFEAVARHLFETEGIPGFAEIAWDHFCEGVRGDTFDRVIESIAPSFDKSRIGSLVKVYRSHEPSIELLSDVRDFLDAAHEVADLAVLTDGPSESQWAKIRALELETWIDEFVVTGERGESWHKPSPKGFEYLQELFEKEPAECVYIADNPLKDFQGPTSLGWFAVRVRRPHGLHVDRSNSGELAWIPELMNLDDLQPARLPWLDAP